MFITVENLTKQYEKGSQTIKALDSVSFQIQQRKKTAIFGPSGSGKTTLLEILGGLAQSTKGKVTINGVDIQSLPDDKLSAFRNKTIGFVFQSMNLQDYLTALENVLLPLYANNTISPLHRTKAEQLLTRVGLKDRMHHAVNELSGGEAQRVAIARALINDPQVLMADEPTAKLDKKNTDIIMQIFEEIVQDGVTLMVITHDRSLLSRFDSIIELEHGVLKPTKTK